MAAAGSEEHLGAGRRIRTEVARVGCVRRGEKMRKEEERIRLRRKWRGTEKEKENLWLIYGVISHIIFI